ncbi:PilW family protein [Acinetobacter variabilis]|nr:PilW family protein [Acinetobacter variabilis]
MTLEDYVDPTSDQPRILSVQLAVISRASDTSTESTVPVAPTFKLWSDFEVTLNSDQPRRYLRTPIVQTVALRNALGDR